MPLSVMTRPAIFWGEVAQGKPISGITQVLAVFHIRISRKTTAMIFKMLAYEKAKRNYGNDACELRQLFVTKSQILAHNVKEYFGNQMKSLSSGLKSREELVALIKCSRNKNKEQGASRILIDSDDIFRTQSTLPDRFSRLQARDFPLFITFDRVRVDSFNVFCTSVSTQLLLNSALPAT